MAGSADTFELSSRARHISPALQMSGATNASSLASGGVIRRPLRDRPDFRAEDFTLEWNHPHINLKETFALHEVLRLLDSGQPFRLHRSTVTFDVDFHILSKLLIDGNHSFHRTHRTVRFREKLVGVKLLVETIPSSSAGTAA